MGFRWRTTNHVKRPLEQGAPLSTFEAIGGTELLSPDPLAAPARAAGSTPLGWMGWIRQLSGRARNEIGYNYRLSGSETNGMSDNY